MTHPRFKYVNESPLFYSLGNISETEFEEEQKFFMELNLASEKYGPSGILKSKGLTMLFRSYKEIVVQLLDLWKKDPPTLVVADSTGFAAIDAATKLKLPFVINCPSFVYPATSAWNIPFILTGFPKKMTFWQRINSRFRAFVFTSILPIIPGTPLSHLNQLRKEIFGSDKIFLKLFLNINEPHIPIFINSVVGIDFPQRLSPFFHYTGPILPGEQQQCLASPLFGAKSLKNEDPKLIKFLENNKKVIFVNFGTTGMLKKWQVKIISEAMDEKLKDYAILWRISKLHLEVVSEAFPHDRRRVFVSTWLNNQQAIMSHPHVRVFISHSGMNSPHEAILYKVPVILIPSATDQFDSKERYVASGAAQSLSNNGFTSSEFADAVFKADSKDSISKVHKFSEMLQIAGGTRKMVEMIQFFNKYGYDHLKID